MNSKNDSRFLSSWGERLAELGLDVRDVNVGRYVQIDLSRPRPEPEEFAEFGEFDTFTVLNPDDVPNGVWLYLNNKRPESRLPLHYISRIETIADRFYLQHADSWDGVTLHIILGGDLRVLSVEPSDRGAITIRGTIDVSDRADRKLGNVSVTDGATETTLERVRALLETLEGTVATESTLDSVKTLLDILTGVDFAKEATLAGVAKESTLDSVKTLLETLAGVDFAKETTLDLVRGLLVDIKAELQTQTGLLQQIADNTTGEG